MFSKISVGCYHMIFIVINLDNFRKSIFPDMITYYTPNIEPNVMIRKICLEFPLMPSNPNTTSSESIGKRMK